jgi:hypothetical protein
MTNIKRYDEGSSQWNEVVVGASGSWDASQAVRLVSGSTTLDANDAGKIVVVDSSTPAIVSIFRNSGLLPGQRVDVVRQGVGNVFFDNPANRTNTFNPSVKIYSSSGTKIADRYTAVTLLCIEPNVFVLTGKLEKTIDVETELMETNLITVGSDVYKVCQSRLFTISYFVPPVDFVSIEFLVVGGGGGGGGGENSAGGGGGGGIAYGFIEISEQSLGPEKRANLTGGSGPISFFQGQSGFPNYFGALETIAFDEEGNESGVDLINPLIVAAGGGGGGGGNSPSNALGLSGGSGGGGGGLGTGTTTRNGGASLGGGFAGGQGRDTGGGGGGGGGSQAGFPRTNPSNGGNGGAGLTFDITGTPVTYGGGGGGSRHRTTGSNGLGGAGGGGDAGGGLNELGKGKDGAPWTGGGGGGGNGTAGNPQYGGSGDGGIVIFRWKI